MGFLFLLVPVFIGVVFLLVFGLIATAIFKGFAQWVSNNGQPVQNRRVRVATKRLHVSGGLGDSSASTWYHATFEDLETSDRQEFQINSTLYSGIADGDIGQLTHQGTRFQGFQRERTVTPHPPTPPPPDLPPKTCDYCNGSAPGNVQKCPSCGAAQFV
jgi:hypothetical protein